MRRQGKNNLLKERGKKGRGNGRERREIGLIGERGIGERGI